MPQYKYPVKGGAKWMTKFNYTDPKSGIVKTAYPTTYVVDKNGNIVGQPIVGAITSSSQAKQLNKLIDQAIENSKK